MPKPQVREASIPFESGKRKLNGKGNVKPDYAQAFIDFSEAIAYNPSKFIPFRSFLVLKFEAKVNQFKSHQYVFFY